MSGCNLLILITVHSLDSVLPSVNPSIQLAGPGRVSETASGLQSDLKQARRTGGTQRSAQREPWVCVNAEASGLPSEPSRRIVGGACHLGLYVWGGGHPPTHGQTRGKLRPAWDEAKPKATVWG